MKWILVSVLIILFVSLHAQQLHFDSYTTNSGLINNEVRCITQGSNGIMYFGTPTGLSSYDGTQFNSYNYKNGFEHSLVLDIQEVENNILFFPLSRFHYKLINGRAQKISSGDKIIIKNIVKASGDKWYASTDNGLFEFRDGKLNRVPIYTDHDAMPLINHITPWRDSLLVVGRGNLPVDVFDTRSWKKIAHSRPVYVRGMCRDKENNIWVATVDDGMLRITGTSIRSDSLVFSELPPGFNAFAHKEFRSVIEDKDGIIWMGSVSSGLLQYDPAEKKLQHITTNNGLGSNTIYSLYNDRENNLWIGTNQGIQKLVNKNFIAYSSKNGLPSDLILDAVGLNDSNIVTTGFTGLGLITNTKQSAHYNLAPENNNFISLLWHKNKLWGLTIAELCELQVSGQSINIIRRISVAGRNRSMLAYGDDILVGGDSGITLINNQKPTLLTSQSVREIRCMTVKGDMLWTGNSNNQCVGYRLIVKEGKLLAEQRFVFKDSSYNVAHCIIAQDPHTIYVGTRLNGLYKIKFSPSATEVQNFRVKDGLSDNNIRSLCFYQDSLLLIGSGSGLDKIHINQSTPLFVNISNVYNFSSTVYKIVPSANGSVWLGTETGLYKLPSVTQFGAVAQSLPVLITSVRLLNHPDSTLSLDQSIKLSWKYGSFAIRYAAPAFTNERLTKYSYWMKGSRQTEWSQPGTSAEVSFSELPPGQYTFLVKAIGFNTEVSYEPATIQITITPPFWLTWWFWLLIILLLSLLTAYFVRRRIRTVRKEAGLKQKIAETEMMALRAQMNPHFIFNCISSIDNFIQDNDKENASAWLNKFAKLIRAILDNSKNEVIPFWKDWETLKLYVELEQLRSDNSFNYTMEAAPELLNGHYRIPPLIVQPYIENAIHHGLKHRADKNGKLLLKAGIKDGFLQYTIEDNGIGRKKAEQINAVNRLAHQSYGMQMGKERIDLYNERSHHAVLITDKEEGTKVEISLAV